MRCPLCLSHQTALFHKDDQRAYYRCSACRLIFVPESFHLSQKVEKSRYDQHENNPDDFGYRRFLNRLFLPMHNRISPGSYGLDFGAGPGPTLHLMFEEVGHTMEIYDLYYADNPALLKLTYDFITSTETVEHLANPRKELERLWDALKPGGYLGIMTKRAGKPHQFANWHYIRDDTHICFFSIPTFEWLADLWQAKLEITGKDTVIFQKQKAPTAS